MEKLGCGCEFLLLAEGVWVIVDGSRERGV